jgi:hypothetical protein
MSNIFLDEIKKYDSTTMGEEELAASELLQKIILAGLSETDFTCRKASTNSGVIRR